jgi:hypothetical protein
MKARLIFDLTEPEDIKAHARCMKSLGMSLALWDINRRMNTIWEESEDAKWINSDLVFKMLEEVMERYDLNLNELID